MAIIVVISNTWITFCIKWWDYYFYTETYMMFTEDIRYNCIFLFPCTSTVFLKISVARIINAPCD